MKFIRQFCIILLISWIGELLKWIIPLPIPASIYGLLLMLICLETGIVPLDAVRETGMFLIDIMPVMFIPAAVGLLDSWSALKPILIPGAIITLVTTILVMAASGWATQLVIRRDLGQTPPGESGKRHQAAQQEKTSSANATVLQEGERPHE